MGCGIKDENNDICGDTFTCGCCRAQSEITELTATLWGANDRIETLEGVVMWASKHIENVFALAGPHDRERQDYEEFLEVSRDIQRKLASKIFVVEQDSAGNLNP